MAYKFVKVKTNDGECSQWMFEPMSLEQVYEFFDLYTLPQKNEASRRIVKNLVDAAEREVAGDALYATDNFDNTQRRLYGGHPANKWDAVHYSMLCLHNSTGERVDPLLINSTMALEMINTRVSTFKNGIRAFYDEEGIVCRAFDERFSQVVEEVEQDTLVFPTMTKPSIDDVRFIMWDGGKHWYAKIGKLDVVINGVQKWDSKEDAIKAAEQFIKNM